MDSWNFAGFWEIGGRSKLYAQGFSSFFARFYILLEIRNMNTKSCCMYYVPSIWILTSDGLRPKKGRDWAEPFWVSQNWAESSWQVSTFYHLHTWLLKFSRLFFKSWAWVIQKSSAHYVWLIVDVSNSNALKWGMNTRVWHMSLTCRSFFSLWHLTLTQDDTWDFPLFVIDGKKTSNVCSALSSN